MWPQVGRLSCVIKAVPSGLLSDVLKVLSVDFAAFRFSARGREGWSLWGPVLSPPIFFALLFISGRGWHARLGRAGRSSGDGRDWRLGFCDLPPAQRYRDGALHTLQES